MSCAPGGNETEVGGGDLGGPIATQIDRRTDVGGFAGPETAWPCAEVPLAGTIGLTGWRGGRYASVDRSGIRR